MVAVILTAVIRGVIFYKNSSLDRILAHQSAVAVLEKIERDCHTFVLYDTDEYIVGETFKKGIFGWNSSSKHSPIVNTRGRDVMIRTDQIGSLTVGHNQIIFGYVNPNEVAKVIFKTNEFEWDYKVHSYYWYIPIPVDKHLSGFQAEQLSVVLKDGTEVFYSFEELQ